ncbi:sulfatase-like hydrolase/transferase [Lacipirellula sp.]|uniref:sulfatase-like hydrolase/transferase n=1 Tax=Lacipirellula sp. TaxID=2691419 RepID=UPI003D10FB94
MLLHRLIVVLAASIALLPAATLRAADEPATPPAPKKPNIVVIVADDLGWNGVGFHNGFVPTPHLDRIAHEGVELDRFYVSPMCSPTRAGLMTGRYALHLGMARSVVFPWKRYGVKPELTTLPEALAAVGYRHRGAFGKWHLGHLEPQWHPLAQGFTDYVGCYNGAADYWTRDREGQIDWHVGYEPTPREGYTTDLIADAACEFINARAGEEPFFCYVPFTAPHEPLQAPESYLKKFAHLDGKPNDGQPGEKQRLAALIASMDDGIGRILAQLEQAGVADDTIVWFFSDNGGIDRIRKNNAPLHGAKLSVYEGGVRVPAAVRWPGHIEGGRKVTTPIMNIDVLPTLLGLIDAPAELTQLTHEQPPLDGVDLSAPLLDAAVTEPPKRNLFFFHGQNGPEREQLAVIGPRGWKLQIVGPDVRRGGYHTPEHKVELYNVFRDPNETTNLIKQKANIAARLGAHLVTFRRSEPADAMPTAPKPADFTPPKNWRNSPERVSTEAKPPASPASTAPADATSDKAASAPKRPDVILFVADDLSWHDIGPYGGDDVRTPRLDQLARQSLRFDDAFAASPTCTPSRSALYTGLYPIRNGAHANHSPINPGVETLPALLNALGYRTVIAGKTHIGPRSQFPFEYLKNSNVRPPGVNNVLVTDLGVAAIDELLATHDRAQPLCLIVTAHSSHTLWKKNEGYDPAAIKIPPELHDTPLLRETRVDYYTDVTQLDTEVGQVLDSMQRHGYGDALFMFTADQGAQFPFAKWNLYDAGIKVPLLVRWPGHVQPDATTTAMVSLIDVLPTIIAAAGAAPPTMLDGQSFLDVLDGKSHERRPEVFAAHTGDKEMNQAPMRCIRTPQFKYIENLAPHIKYVTHITKGPTTERYWKDWLERAPNESAAAAVIDRYEHRPAEELYDVSVDPHELHNLAADPKFAAEKAELRKKLHAWRTEQGEDLNKVLMPADARAGRFPYAE